MLPYNWRDMLNLNSIREMLNKNALVVAVVVGVLLIIMGWGLLKNTGIIPETYKVPKTYFIDEETQEVTVRDATDVPPLMGKSGKATVVEVIYATCTTCAEKQPVYYRKFTDDAKTAMEKARSTPPPSAGGQGAPPPPPMMMWMDQAQLVRAPVAGSKWVPVTSPQGFAIMQTASSKCPNSFQTCRP